MTEYTTFDVVKLLDIKRETLKDWIAKKYIKASRSTRDSRGKKSFFNDWDLHCIYFFKEIIKKGISRKLAAKIICSIRPFNPANTNAHIRNREYLVVTQTKDAELRAKFYSWNNCPNLREISSPDQFENIFIWNFKSIIEEVNGLTQE
jgi:hypothetical protein